MKNIFLVLSLFTGSLFGQDLSQVKKDLEKLTSEEFAGRGYVKEGIQNAANYLEERLKEIEVETVERQSFEILVNTFPRNSSLKLGPGRLKEGKDYILDPRSSGFQGKGTARFVAADTILSGRPIALQEGEIPIVDADRFKSPEEITLFREFLISRVEVGPIILLREKLTWSVGQREYPFPIIEVDRSLVTDEVDGSTIWINTFSEEKNIEMENVIGKIKGHRSDSTIVFTAHYDHLGMMGNAMFPGASDNATGTSMTLDLAKYYSKTTPEFDTYFVFFAAEEAGLKGSKYMVTNPAFDLSRVKFLINLDLMGSAEKGITVVNGKQHRTQMNRMSMINQEQNLVPKIKLRGNTPNSDHYWFAESGVPAIFIYTEGNITAYHDVYDVSEGIDWANYEEVFTLIVEFTKTL